MIGKPYSGELNVRFDEGELEIVHQLLRQFPTLPNFKVKVLEDIVVSSIALLKVAEILVLIATSVALLDGLVEIMVGGVLSDNPPDFGVADTWVETSLSP